MKTFLKTNYPILVFIAVCIYLSFNINRKGAGAVLFSDSEGYYMYLPALFIYHGFEDIPVFKEAQFNRDETTGRIETKYTCGVAILESPFFLLAHGYASVTDYPEDGYSYPYRVGIMMAAIFYLTAGLLMIRKVLITRYSSGVSNITVFLLFAATNLYFYSIRQPGMSHVYSFFLFSLILFLTPRFLSSVSKPILFIYALIIGLIVLIRPTNVIIVLYPLFYNAVSLKDVWFRIRQYLFQFPNVLIAVLGFLIPLIPQFIFWHYISGKWIIYSYGEEGFIYWNRPQIVNVLFSVQNGWFIYTPIALIMVIGLIITSIKNNLNNSRVILFILVAGTYSFASWWAWWFGGAFGHRCYVEFYSLLALSLAYILSEISKLNRTSKIICGVVFTALCYYNISLTYLYRPPWDGENWTWATFGEVLKQII